MLENKKKIATLTLGCKVNLYDTEAMVELFNDAGYETVEFTDTADVYIINTCTVTNFGDKKSRQMIRKARKQNENAVIVACGCYAQVAPEEVSKIEGVNLIIGTKDRLSIVDIVNNYVKESGTINCVSDIMEERLFENLNVSSLSERKRAYLKIQEGCDRFCTYCIIPYARGPVRSRAEEEILNEAKRLSKAGYKEIVLTGIHVASYGKDLKNTDLISILTKVHNIDEIKRIRFSSIEPTIITEDFITKIKQMHKICDHFHLSLQSGCDRTLERMNRRYTVKEYEDAVGLLRERFPNVGITTDIIVGFPDESEEDFIESYEFVKKMKLSKIHVFPYSKKTGTKAALFKDQISSEVKNKRLKAMLALGEDLQKDFARSFIDKEIEVLYEEKREDGYYEGHSTNYLNVKTKATKCIINEIISLKVAKTDEFSAITEEI